MAPLDSPMHFISLQAKGASIEDVRKWDTSYMVYRSLRDKWEGGQNLSRFYCSFWPPHPLSRRLLYTMYHVWHVPKDSPPPYLRTLPKGHWLLVWFQDCSMTVEIALELNCKSTQQRPILLWHVCSSKANLWLSQFLNSFVH